MNDLQDTGFWLLWIQLFGLIVIGLRSEWRKGSAITDELARRAGVGP